MRVVCLLCSLIVIVHSQNATVPEITVPLLVDTVDIDTTVGDTVDIDRSRNAGIFVRLNQKAVNYITSLASEALPQLMNKLSPADAKLGPAKVSNVLIREVKKPEIQAKFLNEKGVRANVTLPLTHVSASASVSVVFWEYSGSFECEIHNLTIGMELHYTRNETSDRNVISVPYCEVRHAELVLRFDQDSSLNQIRDEIADTVKSSLRSAVCEMSVEALRFIDEQDLQSSSATSTQVEKEDELNDEEEDNSNEGFAAADFGTSLCKTERLDKDEDDHRKPATLPKLKGNNETSGTWGADLSLVYPPRFTDDEVVFGLDGGILYDGNAASDIPMPATLNTSLLDKRMIGVLISEYVPNTLFSHLFDQGLGSFHEKYVVEDLPKGLRKVGKMLCAKCALEITAHLMQKPVLQVDAKLGARVMLAVNVTAQFHGRTDIHDLIHANTKLHVTLKPTVRHSRIYGDVSLTNVDINVYDLGVGGSFAGPLEKFVSFVVPRILWPQVKKRLRFALNRRGVKLPVLCGVEFDHLHVDFVDHALVVNTDFTFDLALFIRKFKKHIQLRSAMDRSLPRYVDYF